MTRERIEDFREIVLPFLSRTLLKTNYENMGKSDAEEFEKDFNEILDLAIKALEQEPTTKNDLGVDCIDRNSIKYYPGTGGYMYASKGEIDKLPSVTTKSDLGVDCVSRADVLQILLDYDYANENALVLKDIKALPSVTPQEPKWIPVKFRPLTDEEKNEYPDYCYMADCPMPDDGEEILVCTAHGGIEKDECVFEDGYYLDSGYEWGTDIVAWMPLPQTYKAESEE